MGGKSAAVAVLRHEYVRGQLPIIIFFLKMSKNLIYSVPFCLLSAAVV